MPESWLIEFRSDIGIVFLKDFLEIYLNDSGLMTIFSIKDDTQFFFIGKIKHFLCSHCIFSTLADITFSFNFFERKNQLSYNIFF
jgi:hypothetical protein